MLLLIGVILNIYYRKQRLNQNLSKSGLVASVPKTCRNFEAMSLTSQKQPYMIFVPVTAVDVVFFK